MDIFHKAGPKHLRLQEQRAWQVGASGLERGWCGWGARSNLLCEVTPVILHGFVSPDDREWLYTGLYPQMTGVAFHGVVSPIDRSNLTRGCIPSNLEAWF